MELNEIYGLIEEDLVKVDNELRSVCGVEFTWLSEMLTHSLQGGGKRIRPALTLLAGKFHDYNLEYLLPMATSVELMHSATLVHDDAIDKSMVRRGKPTINKLWGMDRAVLLGDYLFAKAGEFNADTQSIPAVKLFSRTLMTISKGELNQSVNAFNLKQTRQNYIRRIIGKAASLFSLATESGAVLSRAPEKLVGVLRGYGHNLGIAFQIVDDVLDFVGTEEELGKPTGSDLAQGTLTLPAMLLLERYPEDNPVKRLFQNQSEQDREENIKKAIELVHDPEIIQECYKVASDYCSEACRNLNELPASDSRQALADLAGYVVNRKT